MSKNIYITEKQFCNLISESVNNIITEEGKSLDNIDFSNLMLWVKKHYPGKPAYVQEIIAKRILDAQKRKYGVDNKKTGTAFIIAPKPYKLNGEKMIPLPLCFPVGRLKEDMGNTDACLYSEPRFSANIGKFNVNEGRYNCEYKGIPCILYVGRVADPSTANSIISRKKIRGYCLYNDDVEAYKYVQGILGNLGAIKSPSTYSNSFR